MDTEEHSDGPPIDFDDDFVPPYSGYMNHKFAHKQFQKMFVENPFGYACSVCDRLWFEKDLKKATSAEETMLKKITVCLQHNVDIIIISLMSDLSSIIKINA